MAKKSTHSFRLDNVSADDVVKILASADFEIAQSVAQEGNKSCEYKEISRTDDKLVYELNVVEYAKGVKGIDRSKTETSRTVVTWDLKKHQSDWTYTGSQGKRVKVSGGTRVTAAGGGCTVNPEFRVEIKIPLVGGKIEGFVVKAAQKHWSVFERLVRERT